MKDPDRSARRLTFALSLPLSITALAISIVVYAQAARHPRSDEIYEQGQRFFTIKELVESRYLTERDSWDLLYRALEGMVQSLDEYSRFYRPSLAQRFREETNGEYAGIGIVIQTDAPPITVRFPYPGSPAYQAGIRPGDRITQVDGQPTETLGPEGAQKLIKGKADETLSLRVVHPGSSAEVTLEMKRANIVPGSVFETRLVDVAHGIGYLRVHAFQDQTAKEFAEHTDALRSQGMRALIVDLRQNSGGLFDKAQEMANYFIGHGNLVSLVGRAPGTSQDYPADPALYRYDGLPVVLLVDQDTASAAEVLAGALQDYKKALLLGERTYGKGVVQSVVSVRMREDEEAVLKLTTAEYVTPGGQHIERHIGQSERSRGGLVPDYEVALGSDVAKLRELFELQRIPDEFRSQVLAMMGKTMPQVEDRQLQAAVALLRGEPVFRELKPPAAADAPAAK